LAALGLGPDFDHDLDAIGPELPAPRNLDQIAIAWQLDHGTEPTKQKSVWAFPALTLFGIALPLFFR
jgi:hypothetical protein